jgi:hypothetical protein
MRRPDSCSEDGESVHLKLKKIGSRSHVVLTTAPKAGSKQNYENGVRWNYTAMRIKKPETQNNKFIFPNKSNPPKIKTISVLQKIKSKKNKIKINKMWKVVHPVCYKLINMCKSGISKR